MTAALPLWAENIAVFDTETTGVDTNTARVVSAAIALLDGSGTVVERSDWLLDPGIEIPAASSRVHGITTEVARASGVDAATGIAQIVSALVSMLSRGFAVVIYNAPYDLSLLRNEAHRYGIPWPATLSPVIDPLVIDKRVDRYRRGKRTLEAVAQWYGVPLEAAHDAGEDAIASGRVAQAIALKYSSALPHDPLELHSAQTGWAEEQAASFQEYMRRERDPKFTADGRWPVRD